MENVNVIKRVTNYLRARLDGIHVSQDTPANSDGIDELVVATRIGGPQSRFLCEPLFLIDCYGRTATGAYALAERVADALLTMPDVDPMTSGADVNSIYRNQWVDGRPCFSMTVRLIVNV